MSVEFTPAVDLAWRRAAAIARRESRTRVEPFDFLRGLLAESEGHAARSLAEAGFDGDVWTSRFPDDVSIDDETANDETADVAPTASLRLVVSQAHHEAGQLTEEGSLSSDQVLAALIRVADGVESALADCGFDRDRWRAAHPPEPPIPLEQPLDLAEPADLAAARRIIDAAGNRAREALRVLEDHARFDLDDAFLSRQCKELRHDLAAALPGVAELIAGRDTLGDVGVAISTPGETQRGSIDAVVIANARRLEESLRSVEEYGKILVPELGSRIESIRYRAYTLEKALVLGGDARRRLAGARLYALVGEAGCRASLVGTVRELCEGGVDVVQLRDKGIDDRTLLDRARSLRDITRKAGVLLIVNDRPDIAVLADADGVHLGQDDLSVRDARRIVGGTMLIGVSTHTVEQVRQAILDGASYIGVGPTFASRTKEFPDLAGLAFVREAMAETSLPAFAIGGISLETLDDAMSAGASRIAVGHALCGVDAPRRAAALFRQRLDRR